MDLLPLHSWVRTNLCREMFQIAAQAESLGTVHSCGQQNGRCEFKVLRIGFFMPVEPGCCYINDSELNVTGLSSFRV